MPLSYLTRTHRSDSPPVTVTGAAYTREEEDTELTAACGVCEGHPRILLVTPLDTGSERVFKDIKSRIEKGGTYLDRVVRKGLPGQ